MSTVWPPVGAAPSGGKWRMITWLTGSMRPTKAITASAQRGGAIRMDVLSDLSTMIEGLHKFWSPKYLTTKARRARRKKGRRFSCGLRAFISAPQRLCVRSIKMCHAKALRRKGVRLIGQRISPFLFFVCFVFFVVKNIVLRSVSLSSVQTGCPQNRGWRSSIPV